MDGLLSDVHVFFKIVEGYQFEMNEEDTLSWSEKVGDWNKAADAFRSITHLESTFTQPEDGDRRPRKITLELRNEADEMSLEELSNLLKTFGPAFTELHKKGIMTRFMYYNYTVSMDFDLDEKAWEWTATGCLDCLHTRDEFTQCWSIGEFSEDRSVTEAKIEAQMPVWELIARYMYQEDISAVPLDKAI